MHHTKLLLMVLLGLTVAVAAGAAEFVDYPEFRYISGLPGGGYAVDPDGHVGFDGALQVNIPVGYTPGAGNYAITAATAAINGGFPNDYDGADVNGTLAWGLGFFGPDHALWLMDMGTGNANSLESAYNAQFQLFRETEKRPGIAIGVTDAYNERARSLSDPFAGGGVSFFAVATRQAGSPEHPMYYTLGYGNGRFNNRPFGGVSYDYNRRLKFAAEYDGFNPNLGVAWDMARHDDNWHSVLMFSVVDLDRVQLSLSLTRSSHK